MKNIKFYVYNVLVILVIISLMEFFCAFLLNNPTKIPDSLLPALKAYYNENDRSTIQVVPECGQYDSELFYTLRPGSCTFENREFSNLVRINQDGLRDDEESSSFPEIISLGDSFAMGWGVDQDASYNELLQAHSGKKILNAGMSSYGTAREMELLRRLNRDSLKTIIIQYHPNDFAENKSFISNQYQLKISSEDTYDSLVASVNSRGNYYLGKHISLILKHWIRPSTTKAETTDKEEAKAFLDILVHNETLLNETKLVVFEINRSNENNGLFIDELKVLIRQNSYPEFVNNIKIVPIAEKFNKGDYFLLDNHINEVGHNKLSTILYDYIK